MKFEVDVLGAHVTRTCSADPSHKPLSSESRNPFTTVMVGRCGECGSTVHVRHYLEVTSVDFEAANKLTQPQETR